MKKLTKTTSQFFQTLFYFRKYAEAFNEKLTKELLGISTQIKYKSDESTPSESFIRDDLKRSAISRDLLYVIEIDQSCENSNSVDIYVLNQWKNASGNSLRKYKFNDRICTILKKNKGVLKG